MELIILFAVVFFVGWKASQMWHLYTFRSLLQDLNVNERQLRQVAKDKGIELDEPAEEDEHSHLPELEVRIEKHPEGLFAYRKADGFFIAQGKDRTVLMENLVNNLTNVRVVIAKEDGADLIKE